jgi:hypothetical protein
MEELTESFKLYRGALMSPEDQTAPELYWDDVQASANYYLSNDARKHRTWLRVYCPPVNAAAKGKLLVLLTMKPGPLGVYSYSKRLNSWYEPLADKQDDNWRINEASINGLLTKNSRGIVNYERILVLNTTSHIWPGANRLATGLEMCICHRDQEWHDKLLASSLQALREELTTLAENGGTEFDFDVATGPFELRNGGRERIEQYTAIMDEFVGEHSLTRELGLHVNMRAVNLNADKRIPGSELRIVSAVHPNAALFKLPVHAVEVNGYDDAGRNIRTYTLRK